MIYYVKHRQNHAKRKAKRELVAETSRNTGTLNPLQVVIQVKSVGVNFGLDTLVARGAFGSLRASKWEESSEISFPLTPGA